MIWLQAIAVAVTFYLTLFALVFLPEIEIALEEQDQWPTTP